MKNQRESWADAFRALGEALVEVVRAEIATLGELLKRSGRHLAIALALFGAVAAGLFWLFALVLFGAVDLVRASFELQLWQAALFVALGLFLLLAIAGAVGYFFLTRFENPVATVRHRWRDHLGWWDARILDSEHRLAEGDLDEETDGAVARHGRAADQPPP